MLIATTMYPVSKLQTSFESGGKEIRLDCFLPAAEGQRFPAVVALYGSGGGHESMGEPAGMLAAQGFAVYVPHYFDRTETIKVTDRTDIFRYAPAWLKTLWDTLNYVEKQPQVAPDRMALLGFSLGAYLALTVAAFDKRIKAVVEFFGGFPREVKPFMRRFCPVLILHGEADPTVPVKEAYDLKELLERKNIPYEMQIYPGTGHGFSGEIWRDAGLRCLAFLEKHLRSEGPGQSI
jgi:carboxymethylenebutenolidase